MTREEINQALCVILVAGQNTEAIDGEVYAAAMSSMSLATYNFAKALALRSDLIEKTGPHTFRNTTSGNNAADQIRQAMGL